MPGGDRTGPVGMGPMTGKCAGYCAGYNNPGFANPIPGRGRGYWGRGKGGGRGWRQMYAVPFGAHFGGWQPVPYAQPHLPQMTSDQELAYLKDQAGYLEGALEDIKKRIDAIESTTNQ
jgi:hypothetical protein